MTSTVFISGLGEAAGTWTALLNTVPGETSVWERWRDRREAVRSLHGLQNHLRQVGPSVLVAHSLGALYALAAVREFPDLVTGLVLVDPTSDRPTPSKAVSDSGRRRRLERSLSAGLTPAFITVRESAARRSLRAGVLVARRFRGEAGQRQELIAWSAPRTRTPPIPPALILSAGKLPSRLNAHPDLLALVHAQHEAMAARLGISPPRVVPETTHNMPTEAAGIQAITQAIHDLGSKCGPDQPGSPHAGTRSQPAGQAFQHLQSGFAPAQLP